MTTVRTDTPEAWDERSTLTTFLDYARATVAAKCEGLSDEDARKAPLPGSPLMSIAGLVSHVRWVDYFWLRVIFLGEEDHHPATDEDPDREMRIALDVPLAKLLQEYEDQSAELRELVAKTPLDAVAAQPVRGGVQVTLRWILNHLIEETARHNGHLDILRELADGTTGM
ncbi:DinB family protein [Streptomyces muensis]|uniref:DinB family protein n=1 Tax=Streptomyces muensis TaxID=1077944 RepID=A0A9X1Q3G5_STRM4|nr:DinB family protein [Streptomyces muensis]MCF1596898.1 DinB family protein [Streptomyces muensis]